MGYLHHLLEIDVEIEVILHNLPQILVRLLSLFIQIFSNSKPVLSDMRGQVGIVHNEGESTEVLNKLIIPQFHNRWEHTIRSSSN
mgnify:CR=1 FL=1